MEICIQDGEAELWLSTFTNELVELLEKTTKSLESTEDDIEDALMGLTANSNTTARITLFKKSGASNLLTKVYTTRTCPHQTNGFQSKIELQAS